MRPRVRKIRVAPGLALTVFTTEAALAAEGKHAGTKIDALPSRLPSTSGSPGLDPLITLGSVGLGLSAAGGGIGRIRRTRR